MKKFIKVFGIALIGVLAISMTACNNGEGGGADSLRANPALVSFDADGSTTNATVVVTGADWTATDNQEWITVTPASGTNGSTFTVTVTTNDAESSRTGTITVSGGTGSPITVSVTQAGTVNIPVTAITLNTTAMSILTSGSGTLTATVEPAGATNSGLVWESSDDAVATVADGVVTAVADGQATITATAADGSGVAATAKVLVSFLGDISFLTEDVWNLGDQTWSDYLSAVGCEKDLYNGDVADCRRNNKVGYEYDGHLFSWRAVDAYKEFLCPDGWRIPTGNDFKELDIYLGGTGENSQGGNVDHVNEYVNQWGLQFSGNIAKSGTAGLFMGQGVNGYCWTQDEEVATHAFTLSIHYLGTVSPAVGLAKTNGYPLRCVKDNE